MLSLSAFSCTAQNEPNLLIERNSSPTNCADYFVVSDEIESSSDYKKVLGEYLYLSLVDGYKCDSDSSLLSKLFLRDSFVRTVLLFFTDGNYVMLNHYERESRWKESYQNLLLNCTDLTTSYILTDSLLSLGKGNGLTAFWNKRLETDRLSNYTEYVNGLISNGDFYDLAELCIVLHNSNDLDQKKRLLDSIENMRKYSKQFEKLKSLLSRKKKNNISYEEYAEEIFDGI